MAGPPPVSMTVAHGDTSNPTHIQNITLAGNAFVSTEGNRATYSGGTIALALAAGSQDVVTLYGAAGTNIRVTRIEVSGTAGTALTVNLQLLERAGTWSNGTSVLCSAVPHDPNDAAAAASLKAWTTSPTTGGTPLVGIVRASSLPLPVTGTNGGLLVWDFTTRNGKGLLLRDQNHGIAINCNGAASVSGVLNCTVEWTESTD